MTSNYEKHLREALALAEKGKGLVSPNPMVGAVVARGNRILGRGYHQAFGLPHAEVEALKQAGKQAKDATLYVNLEPCCHWGKTPPCTEDIVSAGIKEVVCCMKDPNPLVDGKGFQYLEEHGVKVRSGWLEEKAERLNRPYLTYITQERPYIVLKWAQSLDGKIAVSSGDSKWITSEETRQFVKNLRFEFDGILVGVNTVLQDNPFLDYSAPAFQTKKDLLGRKRYYKIVLDTNLRTPLDGNIWEDEKSSVILFVSERVPEERLKPYLDKPCQVIRIRESNGGLDLVEVLKHLYRLEVGILLVEGGQKVLTSFWEKKLADQVMIFIGNKILGGEKALSALAGPDLARLSEATMLENIETRRISDDLMIQGEPCFRES